MSGSNLPPIPLVIVDSLLIEVGLEACLQIVVAVFRYLQIQHEEGLLSERCGFSPFDVELCLQHTTEDVPDDARLKNFFGVLLIGL